MRKVKRIYNVFSFKELKKDIKQKVLEKLCYINVENEWWDYDDMYNEIAKDYGLEIVMGEICFELDRGSYCYFDTYNHSQKKDYVKGIDIVDYDKFIKKAGLKKNKRLYSEENSGGFWVDHKHYGGGGGKNIIEHNWDFTLNEKEMEKLQNCLDNFIEEVFKQLRKDYDYLTSEKSIVETIKANEYEFLESGEMFC